MSVETVRLDQTRAYVKVSGEVDLATAAPLWAVLDGHLGAGRRFLRLDLAGVSFLDGSALTGLTRVHQDALARRGTLVLTGVSARVARVLRLAGLDRLLFIGSSVPDDDASTDAGAERWPAGRQPARWPSRPVPWMPPGVARRVLPIRHDR